MKKNLFVAAILGMMLVLGMMVVGCMVIVGNTDGTPGGGDPKVFVITGIDDTRYISAIIYVDLRIHPSGSTTIDGYTGAGLIAHADADSRNDEPNTISVDAISGNHTLTANLYTAPALTAEWTGTGTYDVYFAIGLGESNHVYKCANVNISSATTTKSFANFTDVTLPILPDE